MNLFLIRLPYFFACKFSLYFIFIPISDTKIQSPIPNTQILPNQPLYIWDLQI